MTTTQTLRAWIAERRKLAEAVTLDISEGDADTHFRASDHALMDAVTPATVLRMLVVVEAAAKMLDEYAVRRLDGVVATTLAKALKELTQ